MILCLPGALTSVYARARLRSAHLRRSGRGVRVEGLQAGLLCHPHPIRLAAQARQIIFVPSDCQGLCPSPWVIQLPVSVFYFQSKAGPPCPASSPPSLGRYFPSIQPMLGLVPGSMSKVRVTLVASEGGLNLLFFSPSLSCFVPDHSHQHTSTLSHL